MIEIEKDLNEQTEKLVKLFLKENFPGFEEIVSKYVTNSGDSSSEEDEGTSHASLPKIIKSTELNNLNIKHLENVAQDFTMNYRTKTEMISKEIKQSL